MMFFFFVRRRKEKEKDEDDGDGWHNTLVFAMILSQNISFRDKSLLPGKVGRALNLTLFVRLIFDRTKSTLNLMLQDFLFLMADKVGMGAVLGSSGGELDFIAVILPTRLHSWLDLVILVSGDSFLKARHGKEA